MEFQKVVLGNHCPESGASERGPAEEAEACAPPVLTLNQRMPIEVMADFDTMLFFGKLLPGDPRELTVECTSDVTGLPHIKMGSAVLVRGYDSEGNPVLLRAEVMCSSRTRCTVGALELIPYKTKRQYVRYPLNPPADIYLLDGAALCGPQPCQLINISVGGACVVSDRFYAVWQPLRLRVVELSPDGRCSFFRCQIVRMTPRKGKQFEYGLCFVQMDRNSHDSLMRDIQAIQAKMDQKFRTGS